MQGPPLILGRLHSVPATLTALAMFVLLSSSTQAAPDYAKVVGPAECAECHKNEHATWKNTHHFKTFRDMPRSKKTKEFAKALGLKRVKRESLCLDCHFSSKVEGGKPKPIAGISCESCHGAAEEWLKRHSEFSGKKKETESKSEAVQRWADSEAAGMIRPHDMYKWASNCMSCHVVPKEKLVNVAGHPAGSAFNLIAWSQGEVRHNTWWNDGAENAQATIERKRMMFIVGVAVELEAALRGVGEATAKAKYAVAMAKRAQKARQRMAKLAEILGVPEINEMAKAAAGAQLKLNNKAQLTAAADKVGDAARRFAKAYDGKDFAAIDRAIPKKFKGEPKS